MKYSIVKRRKGKQKQNTMLKHTAAVAVLVLAVVALTVPTPAMAQDSKDKNENLPHCESVPQNLINDPVVGKLFAQWQNNEADDCGKCTKLSGMCAWCKKGRVKDIKVLGMGQSDIEIDDFCWPGTPWFLVNNTFSGTFLFVLVVPIPLS